MKKIILAPNPTGTGHNMRLLAIGKKLLERDNKVDITVLLGSRQDVFRPLFEKEGMKVIDLNPNNVVDSSKGSHLENKLNWKTMISNYFVPTFFNGDKILRYLEIIEALKPDLLISDYNINASFAAVMGDIKSVFVTERHNFTLVDVKVEDLVLGGFDVNEFEIKSAQKELKRLFEWLVHHTDLIIADKLFLDSFESDKLLQQNKAKVKFTGAMYVERQASEALDFDELKINPSHPYMACTVSSTTMLSENNDKNFRFYIDAFEQLRREIPDLQLVLIGNSDKPELKNGVVNIPYIPNWKELIEKSAVLVSHPGWITVTEAAYLNIPSIFYLSSFSEYHELEAYRRLEEIGVPVFSGYDVNGFCALAKKVFNHEIDFEQPYKLLCPTHDGIVEATRLIHELIEEEQ